MLDYATENRVRNQDLADSLVNNGLMTQDQATSFLQGSAGSSVHGAQPITTGLGGAGSLDNIPRPTPQNSMAKIQEEIAQNMARQDANQQASYPAQLPSFSDTLGFLSQMDGMGGAEKVNYLQAIEKLSGNQQELQKFNMRFHMLSDKDKERVITRVGIGHGIGTSFGKYHLNMFVGMFQELFDMPNRIEHFAKQGFGLGENSPFRKDYTETAEKWTHAGAIPVTMAKIVWGTIAGTFTGGYGLLAGSATGEDFIHVLSMLAIIFTGGASSLATAGKTTVKGLGKGATVRGLGKAFSDALKSSGKFAHGGHLLDKGATIGGSSKAARVVGKTSAYAQRFEYAFNPEEIPYELIGDYGIGAVKSLITQGYLNTKNWNAHRAVRTVVEAIDKNIADIEAHGGEAVAAAAA